MGQRKLKLINKLKNREEHEEQVRTLPKLPEHIFIEILSKIPPKILRDTFMLVCKSWYRLIRSFEFIEKNAVYHKPGIIVNFLVAPNYYTEFPYCKAKFLQIDEKEFDIKVTNLGKARRMGYIRSSCNGLILVTEPRPRTKSSALCVKNMLTGSVLTDLPSCPSGCLHSYDECGAGLGFNPLTKQYKVVHIYSDGYGFEIFTIGSDKEWRKLPTPFEESYERPYDMDFRWEEPVLINGHVFHWSFESDEYIISMDLRDEKIRKTNLPVYMSKIKKKDYELVEMGGKLSFVYRVSSSRIDVWVLTDFGKQVWSKQHRIIAESTNFLTLGSSSAMVEEEGNGDGGEISENREEEKKKDKLPDFLKLFVVATLRNGEVIVFRRFRNPGNNDPIYLYDMKTGEMRKFKMKMKDGTGFIPHRSSLVSWTTESEMDLSANISNISL
ncbi:hypothetical protein COLO4_14611 [Corchorus olitorius]|uniref:F-box domain-containing protein n=1 Tax=Corchorus olitorius TaxID=93759 RepID=A0A1R3JRR4_9ROSI|nr:hypothetical protein COLO4_14611 [Corchorus olitorius]